MTATQPSKPLSKGESPAVPIKDKEITVNLGQNRVKAIITALSSAADTKQTVYLFREHDHYWLNTRLPTQRANADDYMAITPKGDIATYDPGLVSGIGSAEHPDGTVVVDSSDLRMLCWALSVLKALVPGKYRTMLERIGAERTRFEDVMRRLHKIFERSFR